MPFFSMPKLGMPKTDLPSPPTFNVPTHPPSKHVASLSSSVPEFKVPDAAPKFDMPKVNDPMFLMPKNRHTQHAHICSPMTHFKSFHKRKLAFTICKTNEKAISLQFLGSSLSHGCIELNKHIIAPVATQREYILKQPLVAAVAVALPSPVDGNEDLRLKFSLTNNGALAAEEVGRAVLAAVADAACNEDILISTYCSALTMS
jgi:hypothetical protein